MSQLVTGEAVALDLRTAGLPSRLLAGTVDVAVQATVLLGLLLLTGAVAPDLSGAALAALTVVVFVLVGVGYPVAFETLWRGRTPGKAALGLRVVRDDGGPVAFRQSFVRGLIGFLVERPGITLFSAAVIVSLLNERGKRLGDLLAGTIVQAERVSVAGGAMAVMPPQLASWAATLDLSGLTPDLALSVRQFVSRSDQLTETSREDLGGRLTVAVLAATSPPPPPGTPGWAVLSAVLAERRRREEQRLLTPGAAPAWGPATPPARSQAPAPAPAPPSAAPPPAGDPDPGPGGFVLPS